MSVVGGRRAGSKTKGWVDDSFCEGDGWMNRMDSQYGEKVIAKITQNSKSKTDIQVDMA